MSMWKIFRAAAEPASAETRERTAVVVPLTLTQRLARLGQTHRGDGSALRAALSAVLNETLKEGRAEIRERFFEGELAGDADRCIRDTTALMDRLIIVLADFAAAQVFPPASPGLADRLAIVAFGGYGRHELAPQSDIDVMFLLPARSTPRAQHFVEFVLYQLWDLGLKVGHAVRTVEECLTAARQDMTIRTAMLETRALWSEAPLHDELKRRFLKEVVRGTGRLYVEAKLAERDDRHHKWGDSRYVLEPNIKEGKGGLRDLQTLFWIGKYLYQVEDVNGLVDKHVLTREEANRFIKAQRFLWTLRCHLHYLTGRAEERLTFDVQKEIATRLGYTDRTSGLGVERFMKHYFLVAKDVGDLTRIFCAALEAESQRKPRRSLLFFPFAQKSLDGFRLDGERLSVGDERQFHDRPIDMIRLFHVAQQHDLDIHPHALKLITRALPLIDEALRKDREANRLFLEILTSRKDPEQALRRMNGAGVLGRFVRDFGRVVAQMQYDMYHVYTVDEHTLFAIGILHKIDTGQMTEQLPLATQEMTRIVSRRALYVALLLHDIAKGRGGDHSEIGARIARRLGPRFGLEDEETDTVEWLVRHHLVMSRMALKRDIEDDKTIQDFIDRVESPERLRLLLILTTADISAVGPGRWNAWKGTLLGNLFHRAEERMAGGFDGDGRERRIKAAQNALRSELADWPIDDVESFIAKGYPPYWLSVDTDTHALHAALVREAERSDDPLVVHHRVDRGRAVTEVTIIAADHPGLFSHLAGALAVSGANIVNAKIFTLVNGLALDVFNVQDAATGGAFDAPDKLARLAVTIERSLSGQLRPLQELAKRKPAFPSRTRVFKVKPRVLIENQVSRTHTVIEVNARDRPGLLYDVTRALTYLGLQISSAKISTYGERAVDVFYVKDVFGLKVVHETKLKQIRDKLMAALIDPDCVPGPSAASVIPLHRRPLPPARRPVPARPGRSGPG